MRLLSKNLIEILSYSDQEALVGYQFINKAAYTDYIPKLLKVFKFERPFVHQYLGSRKRFIITYLDNMKAYEMPGIPK